jgi:hypothetical protein
MEAYQLKTGPDTVFRYTCISVPTSGTTVLQGTANSTPFSVTAVYTGGVEELTRHSNILSLIEEVKITVECKARDLTAQEVGALLMQSDVIWGCSSCHGSPIQWSHEAIRYLFRLGYLDSDDFGCDHKKGCLSNE